MKNVILALSLLLNAFVLYVLFNPPPISGPKMSCDQATNETLNKQVTSEFSATHDGSLAETHAYLRASDYNLRNIHFSDGSATFVYTASYYPSSCGWYLTGIDGTIVRLKTDLSADPKIMDVY
jgi:hypothetical protein